MDHGSQQMRLTLFPVFQGMDDRKYNAVNIIYHIIIPKADYFVAQCFQIFRSFVIIFLLFQVLTSIQFDDEFLLDTDKIGNVITNACCLLKLTPNWSLRITAQSLRSAGVGSFRSSMARVLVFGSLLGGRGICPHLASPIATESSSKLGRDCYF